MNLALLPTDFPLLAHILGQISGDKVGLPPDTRSIGEKTYRRFEDSDFTGINVDSRNWRHFPYALWLSEERGLSKKSVLTNSYFLEHLPNAIGSARRPMKWGRPLFFVYLDCFNPKDEVFERLAQAAHNFFTSEAVIVNATLKKLSTELSLFRINAGPRLIAKSILETRLGLSGWITKFELWPGFIQTLFSKFSFIELLSFPDSDRRQTEYVRLVFDWGIGYGNQLRFPDTKAKYAEALLLPWRGGEPPNDLKNEIISRLLVTVGHPQIESQKWYGISAEAKQVFINWIIGRTLDAFFRILQQTADEIWQYRQKFWQAYFRQGYIEEVWIALGEDAHYYLKRNSASKDLLCAELTGVSANQSILLMKIGDIIFCEWSHNGRLRAQKINSPLAPVLYKKTYHGPDLRFESLDFNNRQNEEPGLVHFSSENSGWQRRARDFIAQNVGINVPLAELI
jgi:EH_Signature domain